jgi:hypothetical protein
MHFVLMTGFCSSGATAVLPTGGWLVGALFSAFASRSDAMPSIRARAQRDSAELAGRPYMMALTPVSLDSVAVIGAHCETSPSAPARR